MSARIIDNNKKFFVNWKHTWPSTLQYIRSTMTPDKVFPELEQPVKEIAYEYAKDTGNLPNIDSNYMIYKYALKQVEQKRYENFLGFGRKKRLQRKAEGKPTGLKRFFGNVAAFHKLIALAPFMPMMVKILKDKGIKVPPKGTKRRQRTIISLFLRFVLKPNAPELYTKEVADFEKIKDKGEGVAFGPIIAGVISAITAFLKKVKQKKEEGEPLTKTEEEILDGAERGAEHVEKIKEQKINEGIGDFLRKNGAIIGIVIAIIVYVAFLRK